MVPTWPPTSNNNRLKIDAKIDQKIDPSWDRFLVGFGNILKTKMEQEFVKNQCRI